MRNTKYSNLTIEEFREIKKQQYKEWIEKQSEERLKKYKEKLGGFCDVCNQQCANIYTHRKSQKHLNKVAENEPN